MKNYYYYYYQGLKSLKIGLFDGSSSSSSSSFSESDKKEKTGDEVMETTKRILREIWLSNCSVSTEALKTIHAIDNDSPIIKQRLAFIAKHALSDPQCQLSDDDRKIMETW